MVTNTLHAAAILLKDGGDWDWFINLSASDYPLVTQDGICQLFSIISKLWDSILALWFVLYVILDCFLFIVDITIFSWYSKIVVTCGCWNLIIVFFSEWVVGNSNLGICHVLGLVAFQPFFSGSVVHILSFSADLPFWSIHTCMEYTILRFLGKLFLIQKKKKKALEDALFWF